MMGTRGNDTRLCWDVMTSFCHACDIMLERKICQNCPNAICIMLLNGKFVFIIDSCVCPVRFVYSAGMQREWDAHAQVS